MMPAKKVFGFIGILATITHFVYYLVHPYDTLYFFLGFGLLWLVFVAPLYKV
jgi:hypothetical protein